MRRRDSAAFARSASSPRPALVFLSMVAAVLLTLPAAARTEQNGWLGVALETAEDAGDAAQAVTRGALITGIVENGPADGAGLRAGDLIFSANRSPISSSKDLAAVLQELRPSASLQVRFMRRGYEYTSIISLGYRPARTAELRFKQPWTGLSTAEVPLQLRTFWGGSDAAGLMVTTIFPGGPADVAGFWPGDLILAVDGKEVVDAKSLKHYLQRSGVGNVVEVEVSRQGTHFKVDLELEELPRLRLTS